MALTGTQIYWTVEVTAAFARLEEGYENALRDYYRKQVLKIFFLFIHFITIIIFVFWPTAPVGYFGACWLA